MTEGRAATTKESYEALKASGMMWEFWPEATGIWDKDKEAYANLILRAEIGFRKWEDQQQSEWPDVIA